MERKREKISGTYANGISVAWSPVNLAYFVMFGKGPVGTRSILRVIPDREEVRAFLRDIKAAR